MAELRLRPKDPLASRSSLSAFRCVSTVLFLPFEISLRLAFFVSCRCAGCAKANHPGAVGLITAIKKAKTAAKAAAEARAAAAEEVV